MLNHFPERLRPFLRSLVSPRSLLVFGGLVIAFLMVSLYYYNQLAGEIDQRLLSNSLDNSTGIFTRPFDISIGDRWRVEELTDYLRAIGYQPRAAGDENLVGSFEVDGSAVLIFPGADSGQGSVKPLRVQQDNSGRITSLTNVLTGERLSSASIEGELLATIREGDRRKKIVVQFSDIPDNLRNAILAAEDRRFFTHNGIDWRGIARALRADLGHGEIVQGGSTITQQLIKNDFLTGERTFSRKLKEAAMAMILESRLSKEQIFTLYCNDVYLGQSGTFAINGFAQAAQVYFDKELADLTLGETTFLAGLICAPNRYTAYRDQARAIERRNAVIDAMEAIGSIDHHAAASAKAEQLQIKKHEVQNDSGTSYFIDYAQKFVDDRYGLDRLSPQFKLTTTMDPRLQRAAYGAVKRQTEKIDKLFSRSTRKGEAPKRVQGALIALDAHTGEVLAMVGGRSYDESQLNRATDARRQPGSAFKPFVYATALSSRAYTAASMISDTPQSFSFDGGRSEYRPSDYHGGFTNRNVTLREALTRSLNVPAVSLAMSVGLNKVADVAEQSGIARPRVYPSMALGTSEVSPLELAAAYTVFANDGIAVRPMPIASLIRTDRSGSPEHPQASSTGVFSPQVAYLMTSLMQSVVDQGTAARLRAMGLKGAIAGKTGTSTDGWFVGYTPKIVCVAWVGFDDNSDLGMKASDSALPMWADFMSQALELRPALGGDSFSKPGGLVTVEIDPTTGCLAGPDSLARRPEIFLSGTEPSSSCSQEVIAETTLDQTQVAPEPFSDSTAETSQPRDYDEVTVEVCADTGLLASPDCPHPTRKTVELGKEPLKVCSAELHDPANFFGPRQTKPINDQQVRQNPFLLFEKKARNRTTSPPQ